MRRGSTPTNVFDVNVDLTDAKVYVDYEQDGKIVLEKTGTDLTVATDSVTVVLSQEDTLAFHDGRVLIQLRYVDQFGTADASNIISTTAERIIKDGVIQYGV